MERKQIARLAERLMLCPAAPLHEADVRAEVEQICAEHKLAWRRDAFGNVLVSLGRFRGGRSGRPLVLAAHMDHPGFGVVRKLGRGRWQLQFRGSVPDRYFRPGARVRLFPGRIAARLEGGMGKEKQVTVRALKRDSTNGARPRFGVWDLEDFTVGADRIQGRACDDLIGVTALLATFIELKSRRSRAQVLGVVSRAEEVGFQGALALAAAGTLPRRSLIVSLEASKELPPVRMGDGVILRVGDRHSTFDSAATRFLAEVAADLQKLEPEFRFQRALMPGGTCEATAYQEFNYQTAAVCVALGNYHNCHPSGRIAAEYVSLNDLEAMVQLLVGAASAMPSYSELTGRLRARLQGLLRTARQNLRNEER